MQGDELSGSVEVRYLLDEDLNWRIADGLRRLGVKIEAVVRGTSDSEVVRSLSQLQNRGVWITADVRARRQMPDLIVNQGISVAWIDVQNASSLKQGYLVYSFVYGYMRTIQSSDVPLYFHVQEGSHLGIPRALIDMKDDLPRTRGWFDES